MENIKTLFIAFSILAGVVVGALVVAPYMGGEKLGSGSDFNRLPANATESTVEVSNATSTEVFAVNTSRKGGILSVGDADWFWCAFGSDAATSTGMIIGQKGGTYEILPENLVTGSVNCIAETATGTIGTVEW